MHNTVVGFTRLVCVFALLCAVSLWSPIATQAANNAAVAPTLSAYLLSNNSLIAVSEALVSKPAAARPITGIPAGQTLVAIDMRPQTGGLYGLSYDAVAGTVQLLHIAPISGVAAPVGTTGAFVDSSGNPIRIGVDATTQFGMDFNPTVDRLRIVNSSGQNFRINPNSGAFIDGDLGGAAGSVSGLNPDGLINGGTTSVDATAYTNNEPSVTVTTQYTLDAASNQLFIQSLPNSGTQIAALGVTLGGAPLDFTAVTGFDIPPGVNAASSNQPVTGNGYAVLTVDGTARLYRINLATGAATGLGALGSAPIQGLALWAPTPAGMVLTGPTNNQIARFRISAPGTTATVALAGLTAGETVASIDYRPATGQTYALGVNATANTATLYLLDPQSGALTPVGVAGSIAYVDEGGNPVDLPDPLTTGYGIDFNPTVDRLRVVTASGLNFRLNPNTGAAIDGNLNQTSSPPAGVNPDAPVNGLPSGSTGVDATTYTNNYNGTTVTTQYTLDAASNQLFIQSPPNSGTQINALNVTLGSAPLDFSAVSGFDTPPGTSTNTSNTAATGSSFAALTVDGTPRLYQVNLANGTAVGLGAFGVTSAAGMVTWTAPFSASLSASAPSVSEASGAITLTVTLQGAAPLIVSYATTGGTATASSDYAPISNTLVLTSTAVPLSFSLPILNDTTDEPNETIEVQLNGPGGVATSLTVTILDDDPPPQQNIYLPLIIANRASTTADLGVSQLYAVRRL